LLFAKLKKIGQPLSKTNAWKRKRESGLPTAMEVANMQLTYYNMPFATMLLFKKRQQLPMGR
jgi:hypothetical protein